MKFLQITRLFADYILPPPNSHHSRKTLMAVGAMISTTLIPGTRKQTGQPEKSKPSGILTAPRSRFLSAILFALLFIAQPGNDASAQDSAQTVDELTLTSVDGTNICGGIDSRCTVGLQSVQFIGSSGWAVGTGSTGTILHTADSGITWTLQAPVTPVTPATPQFPQLHSVYFADDQNGWAVGKTGTILHTTNGGMTWTGQTSDFSGNAVLNSVYFTDDKNGWVVGNGGNIAHTANGGTTWTKQAIKPSTHPIFGIDLESVHFIGSKGWAVGAAGAAGRPRIGMLNTVNGGDTWTAAASTIVLDSSSVITDKSKIDLGSVYFTDDHNGWAVGDLDFAGIILHTTDGGSTWDQQGNELGLTVPSFLRSVHFIDADNGLAVGSVPSVGSMPSSGIVLRTSDGGASWSKLTIPPDTRSLISVHIADNNNAYAVGSATPPDSPIHHISGQIAPVTVTRAAGNAGDLAIVPYYTVQDDWATGVHIINTSEATQVVKLRLRRASDSADALDFNLILSPQDEWTGSLDNSTGTTIFSTDDASCTAPLMASGQFVMPAIYAAGAEEGYIEVIAMGQPTSEAMPIAVAAKHAGGVPNDCDAVQSNFFANMAGAVGGAPVTQSQYAQGNRGNALTNQTAAAGVASGLASDAVLCHTAAGDLITAATPTLGGVCENSYMNSVPGALSVSYFIRDAATGIEMGGNAVHINDFSPAPWMTNQETGLFSGDGFGFDYPDLDGGPFSPEGSSTALRGKFETLRGSTVLGSANVLNDWSVATARNVSTDWVVTFPGQYTMLDYWVWVSQGFSTAKCGQTAITATARPAVPLCDFRDIPVTAALTLYDREEGVIAGASGSLVISPAVPGTTNTLLLPDEVNVIEWTNGGRNTPVLGSAYVTTVDPSVLGDFGWASLAVSSKPGGQRICHFDVTSNNSNSAGVPAWSTSVARSHTVGSAATPVCQPVVNTAVPMVGFVAWERSFPQNPDGNYGRLIDHSFK